MQIDVRGGVDQVVGCGEVLHHIVGVGIAVGVVFVEIDVVGRGKDADPAVAVAGILPPRGGSAELLRRIGAAVGLAEEAERERTLVDRRAGAIDVVLVAPDLGGRELILHRLIGIRGAEVPLDLGVGIRNLRGGAGDGDAVALDGLAGFREGLLHLVGVLIRLVLAPVGHAEREVFGSVVGIGEELLLRGQLLVRRNRAAGQVDDAHGPAHVVALLRVIVALIQRQRDGRIGVGVAVLLQIAPVPLLQGGDADEGRAGVAVGDDAALQVVVVDDLIALRRTFDVRAIHEHDLAGVVAVDIAAVGVVAGQAHEAVAGFAVLQDHGDLFPVRIQIGGRFALHAVHDFAAVQQDGHRRQILVLEPCRQAAPHLASIEAHRAHEGVDDGSLMAHGGGNGVAGLRAHGFKDVPAAGGVRHIRGELRIGRVRHVIADVIALRRGLDDALLNRIEIFVALFIEQWQIAEGAVPVPAVDAGVPQAVHHDQLGLDHRSVFVPQGLAVRIHALAVEGQHDVRALLKDSVRAIVAPHLVDDDFVAGDAGVGEVRAHPVIGMMLADLVFIGGTGRGDVEVAPIDDSVHKVFVVQAALLDRIAVENALRVVLGQALDGEGVVLRGDGHENGLVFLAVLIDGEAGRQLLALQLRRSAEVPGLDDLDVHRAHAQVGHGHVRVQRAAHLIVVVDRIDVLSGDAYALQLPALVFGHGQAALHRTVGNGDLAHEVVVHIPLGAGRIIGNRRDVMQHLDPLVRGLQRDRSVRHGLVAGDVAVLVARHVIQLHVHISAMELIVVVQPDLLHHEGQGFAVADLGVDEHAGGHVVQNLHAVVQLDGKLLARVPLVGEAIGSGIAADFFHCIGVLCAAIVVLGQAAQQPGRHVPCPGQRQRAVRVDRCALRQHARIRRVGDAVLIHLHDNAAARTVLQRGLPLLLDLELGFAHQRVGDAVGRVVVVNGELVITRGKVESACVHFGGLAVDGHARLAHAVDQLPALRIELRQAGEGGIAGHQLGLEAGDGLGDGSALGIRDVFPFIRARDRTLERHGDGGLEALGGLGHPFLGIVQADGLLLAVFNCAAIEHVAGQLAGIGPAEAVRALDVPVHRRLLQHAPEIRTAVAHHGHIVIGGRHGLQHKVDVQRAIFIVLGQRAAAFGIRIEDFTAVQGLEGLGHLHVVHALHGRGFLEASVVDREAIEIEGHVRAIGRIRTVVAPGLGKGEAGGARQRADGQAAVVDPVALESIVAIVVYGQLVVIAVGAAVVAVLFLHIIVDFRIDAGIGRQARDGHGPVVDALQGVAHHLHVAAVGQLDTRAVLGFVAAERQQIHPVRLFNELSGVEGIVAPLLFKGEFRLLDQHQIGAVAVQLLQIAVRGLAEIHAVFAACGQSIERVFHLVVGQADLLRQGGLDVDPLAVLLHLNPGRDGRAAVGMAVPPLHACAHSDRVLRVQQGEFALGRVRIAADVLVALGQHVADDVFAAGQLRRIQSGEADVLHVAIRTDVRLGVRHQTAVPVVDGHMGVVAVAGSGGIADPGDAGGHAGLADIAERCGQRGIHRRIQHHEVIARLRRCGQAIAHAGTHRIGVLPLPGEGLVRIRHNGHRVRHRHPFVLRLVVHLELEVVDMGDPIVHPLNGHAQRLLQRIVFAERRPEHEAPRHGHQDGVHLLRRRRGLGRAGGPGFLRGLRGAGGRRLVRGRRCAGGCGFLRFLRRSAGLRRASGLRRIRRIGRRSRLNRRNRRIGRRSRLGRCTYFRR